MQFVDLNFASISHCEINSFSRNFLGSEITMLFIWTKIGSKNDFSSGGHKAPDGWIADIESIRLHTRAYPSVRSLLRPSPDFSYANCDFYLREFVFPILKYNKLSFTRQKTSNTSTCTWVSVQIRKFIKITTSMWSYKPFYRLIISKHWFWC